VEAPLSPTARPAPVPARLAFALSPVLLRTQGGPVELRIPPGTRTIVLELEGDPAMTPTGAPRLRAVIATVEGKQVWSGEARRLTDRARPSLLASVAPPPDRLVRGDYLVTLSAGDETLYRYFFRVPAR